MSTLCPLSQLAIGQSAVIHRIAVEGALKRRLQDLGLLCGRSIVCLHRAPWGGPCAYGVCHTVLGLRQTETAAIFVQTEEADTP